MAIQEYKCRQCQAKFNESELSSSKGKNKVKCPECKSTDIESLDVPSGFWGFLRSIMASGGS